MRLVFVFVYALVLAVCTTAAPVARFIPDESTVRRSSIRQSELDNLTETAKTIRRGPLNLAEDASLSYIIKPKADRAIFRLVVTNMSALNNTENERVWVAFGFGEPGSGSVLGADVVTAEFKVGDLMKCEVVDRYVPFAAYPLDVGTSDAPELQIKEDKVRITYAILYASQLALANYFRHSVSRIPGS